MHCDPLASRNTPLVSHSPKGGHEPASKACSHGIIKFVWQPDQVDVCIIKGHIFCKGAPVCKARLELMVAYLVISGLALGASPASADKRNRDPVALFPFRYIFSNSYDFTGQFMPWNMG